MNRFNYYDAIAPIYDQARWITTSVAEDVTDFILDLVGASSETAFLEPGVGTGLNVFPLVERGYQVTGVDISREMLDQFRQKFDAVPQNLTLIQADASQLPFPEQSFDVVLTVHMMHTISNWRTFLDDIERVLTPGGFYLNAQWTIPPAHREFLNHFRAILTKYQYTQTIEEIEAAIAAIDVENYLCGKGYRSDYLLANKWTVTNTVDELLYFCQAKAYGLCWHVPETSFDLVMEEFEAFCLDHYGSRQTELSSEAKFEIWAYQQHIAPKVLAP